MRYDEYMRWVRRLSQYDPDGSDFYSEYNRMIRAGVGFELGNSIAKAARGLYEERRRPIKGRDGSSVWIDEFADPWGPNGRYGAALVSRDLEGGYVKPAAFEIRNNRFRSWGDRTLFNTEGEKQMEKIDWSKPLRARHPATGRVQDQKVYTYKSGNQRVVWIDERVYPVDDQGRAVATVQYPGWGLRTPGQKLVENVPEEEFFVGLYRHIGTSNYFLEDGGVMKARSDVKLVEYESQWIVDTRKSAEPPKAIEHDPEDYVTVYLRGGQPEVSVLRTKCVAEAYATEPGEQVVRVRTTLAPADTSRYIQLYRSSISAPWKINAHGLAKGGSQEFTWDETKDRGANPLRCAIKVRD